MVTDEERDYMYAEYAKDPRMKLNVGIRRRLAPLLDNGRDEIQLVTAILFSLPGSPVLYYGDEIGMGDNVFLGDRDGVRTPMQWTGDRNGGFSRADFAQLYAPPLMDPVFGFQAVNVEAQLRSPTSLLRWFHRFIALRKQHPVFGFGSYEPIETSNPRIFAHIRRLEDDLVLCVHNLARSAQAVELDLRRLRRTPSGRAARRLAVPADRQPPVPADVRARAASSGSRWRPASGRRRSRRRRAAPYGRRGRRWLIHAAGGRIDRRPVRGRGSPRMADQPALVCVQEPSRQRARADRERRPRRGPALLLAIVQAHFANGMHHVYQLPLGLTRGGDGGGEGQASAAIARNGEWLAFDALADSRLAHALMARSTPVARSPLARGHYSLQPRRRGDAIMRADSVRAMASSSRTRR